MLKLQDAELLGGGANNPNLVVLIDETHSTKKKKNRGGFVGRTPVGHTTVVVGFFELDISQEPRKGTGRSLLIEIPNKTRATLVHLIGQHVQIGSVIWTDGFSSYKFLGHGTTRGTLSPTSGHIWDWVNFMRRILSR